MIALSLRDWEQQNKGKKGSCSQRQSSDFCRIGVIPSVCSELFSSSSLTFLLLWISDSSCPFRSDNRKERNKAWEGQGEGRPSGGRSAAVIRSVWCHNEGSKEGVPNCLLVLSGDEVWQRRREDRALPAPYKSSYSLVSRLWKKEVHERLNKNSQKIKIMQKFRYCDR